jgi:hypothetical protein
MFFRLTHINGAPLPCTVVMHGSEHQVTSGGLLLEPPGWMPSMPDGYSVLQLFEVRRPDSDNEFLVASLEPYRLDESGRVDISRRDSDKGSRFSAQFDRQGLTLRAEAGLGEFVPPGTSFELVAAPDDPITDEWAGTFNFGPPHIQPAEPWRQRDPAVQEEIRNAIAADEPARLHAARDRLERAWRAPAS